ncbi:unnamed protein product [marine sediment metagenome]|uniref:Uncharacterized protein n=1 Tax=marine sediment metagenome TaxID=412755 RepID=X1EUY4_9ZZZZ
MPIFGIGVELVDSSNFNLIRGNYFGFNPNGISVKNSHDIIIGGNVIDGTFFPIIENGIKIQDRYFNIA